MSPFRQARQHPWVIGGAFLLLLTLTRIVMGAILPLTPDEAYYRVWALAPAAGYLDHPPMVAVFIRIGMAVLGDTACGVRFMGPISAACGTVLLAMAARGWFQAQGRPASTQAGLKTAVLLNGTVALGVGTLLMTPDTPLLFFMAMMLWALAQLCCTGKGVWWLAIGFSAGLGFDSKYTALLPVAGLGLWLVVTPAGRAWLKTIWPWIAVGIAALCVSPVVWWNATHGWASFLKQGGRTGDWYPAKMVTYFTELLGGQIGLASPGVFVFFVAGSVLLWRQKDAFSRLLLCMILLPLAVFLQHAIGARVQANWPVVIYPALSVAASLPAWKGWKAASLFGMALVAVIMVQAVASPARLSPHVDMTLRQMGGWLEFGQQVAARVSAESAVVVDEYGLGAELAFYMPAQRQVIAVEPRWALFALPHAICGEAYLIRSHRRRDVPDPAFFDVLAQEPDIARVRRGMVAETYAVFHVRLRCDLSGHMPDSALLPRRS